MSAPRLPKKESYWENKGKKLIDGSYKNVMIYTHDDLDGIYSGIMIKKILKERGFNILGYGILNYIDQWKYIDIDTQVINIAVDFAYHNDDIDIFVDHHQGSVENDVYAIKMPTTSAFEAICLQYGVPCDSIVKNPIEVVDSAMYEEYGLKFVDTMNFSYESFKKTPNPKLAFTGSFNQMIKRGDFRTLIETIHHTDEPSIYSIYLNYINFYKGNNITRKGDRIEFMEDGTSRIETVKKRCTPKKYKRFIKFNTFFKEYTIDNNLKVSGYVLLGKLAFFPSASWANGIRARAILEQDIKDKKITPYIDYILLQYGNTLQMVAFKDINKLPVKDIGKYMIDKISYFESHGYMDLNTCIFSETEQSEKNGGHKGIGTISNISGKVYEGSRVYELIGADEEIKYIDVFKNSIIKDIGIKSWPENLVWSRSKYKPTSVNIEDRIMLVEHIRTRSSDISEKEFKYIKKNFSL